MVPDLLRWPAHGVRRLRAYKICMCPGGQRATPHCATVDVCVIVLQQSCTAVEVISTTQWWCSAAKSGA